MRLFRHVTTWVLVEGFATPIYDGHALSMILATSRDVTAKHAAEEPLSPAERRYRSLVEQLPLVIYIDALGPWPLLQKPFNARWLAGKIREVLDVAPAA
jgi:PAS domain-containing protein